VTWSGTLSDGQGGTLNVTAWESPRVVEQEETMSDHQEGDAPLEGDDNPNEIAPGVPESDEPDEGPSEGEQLAPGSTPPATA
jgi:hypothetical protein